MKHAVHQRFERHWASPVARHFPDPVVDVEQVLAARPGGILLLTVTEADIRAQREAELYGLTR